MKLITPYRWFWILTGVAVGWIVGEARQTWRVGDFSRYGTQIKSAARLRAALVNNAPDGNKVLTDLVVYPEKIAADDGRVTQVDIVGGSFYESRGVVVGTPQPPPGRHAAYFVAERPFDKFADATAYLESLRALGVRYSIGWWRQAPAWIGLHIAAGVVLIGFAWPTLINLLKFGTWRRPVEAAGPDLPQLHSPRPEAAQPETSMVEVSEMLTALEGSLEERSATPTVVPQAVARSVIPLHATPLQGSAYGDPVAHKEFGADREDFYPTELKAHPTGREGPSS